MKKYYFILLFFVSLFSSALKAQSGNALDCDGTRYMKIPNHADFNVTSTESFTVSMWVNVSAYTTNARFVCKRSMSTTLADKSGWELWGSNSATQFCAVNSPNAAGNHNNSVSAWATDATANTNTWAHFAFVVDRTTGKMYEYLNGVEKANTGTKDISVWACNNPYDIFVGAGITGTAPTYSPTYYFKGKIDNLRIWKKALSPAEIIADGTSTVTNTTPGLVAAYDFETVTGGTTVADITGNHPGTLVNWPKEQLGNKISSLNSSIGTQVGQYVSTQTLQDAITAAQTVYNDPNSTDANYSTAITALNTAVASATISMPIASTLGSNETLYAIYTPNRNNATLQDAGTGNTLKSQSYTTAPSTYLNTQLWAFVDLGDGTYAVVNPFTNNYIANNGVTLTTTPYTTAGWTMNAASTSPLVTLHVGTSVQINTSATAGLVNINNYGGGTNTTDVGCSMKIVKIGERTTTVNAPTVDVPAGAVATGTPITVSCANTSDVIYYTLDDSDPKTSQTRITINGGSGTFNSPQGNFTLKAFVDATQTHFASQTTTVAYSIITSLNQTSDSKYNVKINNGFVSVDGVENFNIYSIAGQKLDQKKALKNGAYMLKIGNHAQKLIIK